MLGDYMIPHLFNAESISDITLALFQDSGWYKVHYYSGGLFRHGKDEGCSFLEEKCIKNGIVSFPKEFCNIKGEKRDNASKGYCDIRKYNESIPEEYRYFEDETIGGNLYEDYCPVAWYTDETIEKAYSCKFGKKDQYPSELEEVIRNSSICIESSLTKKGITNLEEYKNTFRPICHQVICNKEKKEIIIKIGNVTVSCPRGTSNVTVEGYEGMLKCPDYSRICAGSVWCSDPEDCVNKKSSSLLVNGEIIGMPLTTETPWDLPIDVDSLSKETLSTKSLLFLIYFLYIL